MLAERFVHFSTEFKKKKIPPIILTEAKNRVLDTLGCFYGAFNARPVKILRETLAANVKGECRLWGTPRKVPAEVAAWANGAAVRALDFNDTYLSKEPCHPSDLIPSLWAACELSSAKNQGLLLLRAIVLGYDVLCRLCDANSLRVRGWDHVTYLPIASAVGCSYILGLNPLQTRNAIAMAVVGNNALRQTRVGDISDWKAACAAYAARAGLSAARLAKAGFTGPNDIFSGRHGFFKQVSGPFSLRWGSLGKPWMIHKTHVKYFPAEHHAQSAIEAAIRLRSKIGARRIKKVVIECFDVAVSIIGSEKEKWSPKTRETADHSIPYLTAAALLDGEITLRQFERKRYADSDIHALMRNTCVVSNRRYTKLYPEFMPTSVHVVLGDGSTLKHEVLLPKGYSGRSLTKEELERKFFDLTGKILKWEKATAFMKKVKQLETLGALDSVFT